MLHFVLLAVLGSPVTEQGAEDRRLSIPEQLVNAVRKQVGVTVSYDPAYVRLAYPGGDVPKETGVCTDVVIRALRAVGLDLQKAIYVDRRRNPLPYGAGRADYNIDHRRVTNQQIWFKRSGWRVRDGKFLPGDIVAWQLPNGRLHIGIVTGSRSVVHNIGAGAQEEDVLRAWRIIGHYRHRE